MHFVVMEKTPFDITEPGQVKAAQVLMKLQEIDRLTVFHSNLPLEEVKSIISKAKRGQSIVNNDSIRRTNTTLYQS